MDKIKYNLKWDKFKLFLNFNNSEMAPHQLQYLKLKLFNSSVKIRFLLSVFLRSDFIFKILINDNK